MFRFLPFFGGGGDGELWTSQVVSDYFLLTKCVQCSMYVWFAILSVECYYDQKSHEPFPVCPNIPFPPCFPPCLTY